AGVVALDCKGNAASLSSGFYAEFTNLTVRLPTSVASYSAWDCIIASMMELGLSEAQTLRGGHELLSLVTVLVNGVVASQITNGLNEVLSDQTLAPCPC